MTRPPHPPLFTPPAPVEPQPLVTLPLYTPNDWYWNVDGQIYSSAQAAYVNEKDSGYVAWLARGLVPTVLASDTELQAVQSSIQEPVTTAARLKAIEDVLIDKAVVTKQEIDTKAEATAALALEQP